MNKVILMGRLTKDVEVRTTGSGLKVANFTLAVDRDFSEGADFLNCIAWRQPAEYLAQYAEKGFRVLFEGRVQTRTYEDNEGDTRYVTEFVADNVKVLDYKEKKEEPKKKYKKSSH